MNSIKRPLMPKAVAIWLIENTTLTFSQIANFCEFHELEVQAIANEEIASGIAPQSPIATKQLTQEEIKRCEADPSQSLKIFQPEETKYIENWEKKSRKKYLSLSKRHERPNAVAWLLLSYPELTDNQIANLVGSTNKTVLSIRNKTHKKMSHIKPQNPVLVDICSQSTLDKFLIKHSLAASSDE